MDPFSLALGVLTVVQTSAEAIDTLYNFAKDVRDAREEIQSLSEEADSLREILHSIDETIQDPKVTAYISQTPAVERNLLSLKTPLEQCQKRVEELMTKLKKNSDIDSHGNPTIKHLRWAFVKGDVASTRSELKQALNNANFAFAKINFTETLRKNADQHALRVTPEKRTPSPLNERLEELKKQGDALRNAASDGDVRAIELLLDEGTPVDSKDAEGRTALSFAAEYGNIETVKFLIKRKAYVNVASNAFDEGTWTKRAESKRTPLHWAAFGGHIIVVNLLLDAGANLEASTKSQRTPAIEAAMNGHAKTLQALLDRGSNINARTFYGWTMLHTAASTGRVELADIAISHGADVEAVYTGTWHGEGKRNEGATRQRPLHYAVQPNRRPNSDETAIIELLIVKGKALVSAQDEKGATPIHYAVKTRWKAALEVLLKHATIADIAVKDSEGNTALEEAKILGNEEMVDLIGANRSESKPNIGQMRSEETFP